MKQVISGKKYDTETATLLAEYSTNGMGRGDFRWHSECLYRTKNGRFFLAGEGGAMSRWASPCPGGGSMEGDGIEPLSEEEARAWVESHKNSQYEKIFGVTEEA